MLSTQRQQHTTADNLSSLISWFNSTVKWITTRHKWPLKSHGHSLAHSNGSHCRPALLFTVAPPWSNLVDSLPSSIKVPRFCTYSLDHICLCFSKRLPNHDGTMINISCKRCDRPADPSLGCLVSITAYHSENK